VKCADLLIEPCIEAVQFKLCRSVDVEANTITIYNYRAERQTGHLSPHRKVAEASRKQIPRNFKTEPSRKSFPAHVTSPW
jgi:hypothetical protein